ncbi:MAG: hypothetical protein K2I47_06310, partial [Odoribacter sp.]|nr:hypothetical protein [Odoribacter sp.]
LDVHDVHGVIDTLVGVMMDLVSGYSSKDSIIYLESSDLGIAWLMKPVSAEMDGSIHISRANTLQMRYLVAEAVSSLGAYACTQLAEYAMSEAMGAVGDMSAQA